MLASGEQQAAMLNCIVSTIIADGLRELTNKFEKFAERVRNVLIVAQEKGQSLNLKCVDTEHILLSWFVIYIIIHRRYKWV